MQLVMPCRAHIGDASAHRHPRHGEERGGHADPGVAHRLDREPVERGHGHGRGCDSTGGPGEPAGLQEFDQGPGGPFPGGVEVGLTRLILDLENDAATTVPDIENLGQGGHTQVGEFAGRPAYHGPAGQPPRQPGIMHTDQIPVGAAPHVHFYTISAGAQRGVHRLDCVLRAGDPATAVTKNLHEPTMPSRPYPVTPGPRRRIRYRAKGSAIMFLSHCRRSRSPGR